MASKNRRNRRSLKRFIRANLDVRPDSLRDERTDSSDAGATSDWTGGPSGGSFLLSNPREVTQDLTLIRQFGFRYTQDPERWAGLHDQMQTIAEKHPDAKVRNEVYDTIGKQIDRETKQIIALTKGPPASPVSLNVTPPSQTENQANREDEDDEITVIPQRVIDLETKKKTQLLELVRQVETEEPVTEEPEG